MNRTRFPYEDLIFENRNKAYGAYELRVNYQVNLMKAFFIGMGSLSIIAFMIFWINRPDIPKIVFKETSTSDLSKVYDLETNTAESIVPVKQHKKIQTIPPPSIPIDPHTFTPVKEPVEPLTTPVEPIVPSGPIEPLAGSEPGSGSPSNFNATALAGNGNTSGPVVLSSAAVDKQPMFPGGMDGFYKYLSRHMSFPEAAKREGISAKLFVSFVIDKEGNLVEIEFIKKAGYGMEESVMAVLEKSPKWIPGQVGTEHVNTKMILPVNFNLVQ
jgi:protein TonB